MQTAEQSEAVSAPRLLAGRVALVTGASRGIGAATAQLLARHGAAVGVNYHRNAQAAAGVVAAIAAEGGRALAAQADVGDPDQVGRMVAEVAGAFGPIDTLVLNATANRDMTVAPFTELDWAAYEDLLVGETKALFLTAKHVVPAMIERRRGCIIAVSAGLSRTAMAGWAGHSSGKAAADALVRTLAAELGPHGIRVNAVAPGLVQTDASAANWQPHAPGQPTLATFISQATPLRRIALPEDVAGAILMLASDAAGFVTGCYLPVSGGMQMV